MDNTFYQQLLEQETALENELSAVEDKLRILREFKSSFFNNDNKQVSTVSEAISHVDIKPTNVIAYSTDLTIPKKVLAALSQFKKANVSQIADKIIEFEPEYGLEKAKKDVKHHISRLSKGANPKVIVVQPGAGKRSGIYKYKEAA